jgi:hypothetical protein
MRAGYRTGKLAEENIIPRSGVAAERMRGKVNASNGDELIKGDGGIKRNIKSSWDYPMEEVYGENQKTRKPENQKTRKPENQIHGTM